MAKRKPRERVIPEVPEALAVHLRRVLRGAEDPGAMRFAIEIAAKRACVAERRARALEAAA